MTCEQPMFCFKFLELMLKHLTCKKSTCFYCEFFDALTHVKVQVTIQNKENSSSLSLNQKDSEKKQSGCIFEIEIV